MDPTTVGVDLAKSVFQLALADQHGHLIGHRRLSRPQFDRFLATTPPCRLILEACGSAHHWGRTAQGHGHQVSLLPAQYTRPFVRRNKTDRADAEALLQADQAGGIRPVPVKTVAQQELMGLHRIRAQWMSTRTARINAVRGLLREYGRVLPPGARAAVAAARTLVTDAESGIPGHLRRLLSLCLEEIHQLDGRLVAVEETLGAIAKADPVAARLLTVPGIGVLTATALLGSVGHIHGFARARRFASWLGLTPREHSSGPRRLLGRISKRGDAYLRALIIHGARAVLLAAHRAEGQGRLLTRFQQWALATDARCGHNKAAVAIANKQARIIWAVWTRDVPFERRYPSPKAA
jgi:transposase